MEEVNNALSPHGGKLIERVLEPEKGRGMARAAKITLTIEASRANEIMSICYGFFSPLEGFMGYQDVDSVCHDMRLANGYVWSVPIVFDLSADEVKEKGIKAGESILLTYQNQPFAVLEVEEIFSYDKELMAEKVYGTTEDKHPGVKRTYGYKDQFLGGKVTIINPPIINPPFDQFWYPPKVLRQKMADMSWKRAVAHQTRNVPHTGHEWLMKGAWFSADADGVLVSCVVGEKRAGDYIDEAIVLCHDVAGKAGYFKEGTHLTSILLWDMRYAGPREAIFHAIVRKNLGCTHHMFGRDHAGVGTYYSPYAAHEIFSQVPDLGIKSVLTLEWWYCPTCGEVTYSGLCGHTPQQFSGTVIRSIIQDGVKPPRLIFRPEVFDLVMESGEKYGFGSPFVAETYLQKRNPVISVPVMEV
jgi:sulfate adenylyltransferase